MAGERYEQENQSGKTLKGHERKARHTLNEVSFEYQALWIQTGFYFITTCLVYRWQILQSRKHVIEEYKKHKSIEA